MQSQDKVSSLVVEAERTFDCMGCGLEAGAGGGFTVFDQPKPEDKNWTLVHAVFTEDKYKENFCYYPTNNYTLKDTCKTCYSKIEKKVNKGFSAAGGLGLFFSFPEVRECFYYMTSVGDASDALLQIIGVIATHKVRVLIRDMGEFA